jgi:hypothetical protein
VAVHLDVGETIIERLEKNGASAVCCLTSCLVGVDLNEFID